MKDGERWKVKRERRKGKGRERRLSKLSGLSMGKGERGEGAESRERICFHLNPRPLKPFFRNADWACPGTCAGEEKAPSGVRKPVKRGKTRYEIRVLCEYPIMSAGNNH